jgi:hypothetical protein
MPGNWPVAAPLCCLIGFLSVRFPLGNLKKSALETAPPSRGPRLRFESFARPVPSAVPAITHPGDNRHIPARGLVRRALDVQRRRPAGSFALGCEYKGRALNYFRAALRMELLAVKWGHRRGVCLRNRLARGRLFFSAGLYGPPALRCSRYADRGRIRVKNGKAPRCLSVMFGTHLLLRPGELRGNSSESSSRYRHPAPIAASAGRRL